MSSAMKFYFFVFNLPLAIVELCILFGISRSTIYKTMKNYGCETVRLSTHSKRRGVKAWTLWKFAKAKWFEDYYQECNKTEELSLLNEFYENLLLNKNGLKDKRYVRKSWPKFYRLKEANYIDLTEMQLIKAVQCRLIPTVEYFGEFYVEPSFFEQIQRESEVKHEK